MENPIIGRVYFVVNYENSYYGWCSFYSYEKGTQKAEEITYGFRITKIK